MSEGTGRAPVLLVEDYEPVAELERRALVRAGEEVRVVSRVGEALRLLEQEPFSAVLLDYQLPDGDPWSVVAAAHSRVPRIPVIVVTAMGNERVAADALHHGVAEYVRKVGTFYEDLPDVVARVVKRAQAGERLREEVKKAEGAARALEAMLDAMPDLMLRLSADGTILDCRAHSAHELPAPPEKLVGGSIREIFPPALVEECLRHVRAVLETRLTQRWEYQLPAPDGPRDHDARFVPGGPGDVLAIIRIRR
ncbi:MAG TPA: response regulator [Myxococcaceae bacterium]|nr:response regulator [Myxococcaceae bacterium]